MKNFTPTCRFSLRKRPKGGAYEAELKPRVIVDFNCVVLDCVTVEERDALAKTLKDQLATL